MNVLGISSLDTDATVALVKDAKVCAAIAEERLSRIKMHAGFPHKSLAALLQMTGTRPQDIDVVTYPFFDWYAEGCLMSAGFAADILRNMFRFNWKTYSALRGAMNKESNDMRGVNIPGLPQENYYMKKGAMKEFVYKACGGNAVSDKIFHWLTYAMWLSGGIKSHFHFNAELKRELEALGLLKKLKRFDHHETHAASAYFASGFEKTLVVTLDAYGSGLAGTIWLAASGRMNKLAGFSYPNSFGLFYESLTASLGFKPLRHEGKIVGLAAYGDPGILYDAVSSRFRVSADRFLYVNGCNHFFLKDISIRFKKYNVAAAYQSVLENVVQGIVEHFAAKYDLQNVAISGGVTANVKLNQRIFEAKGIKKIFIFPDMGDGGTSVGGALMPFIGKGLMPSRLKDVYLGPEYSRDEIKKSLDEEGLSYNYVQDIDKRIAELLVEDRIIARYDGRMEFGPRALGNRSILYQAKNPDVNQWLNKRLGRTEFMPFAPVTLYEKREMCYKNIDGGEHAAEFMTITFDCTDWMKQNCPAAVHVDGTARPQLIKKETNPGYYRILEEYYKLTGIPTVINTSFNMHEEPIVCTPYDAIRAFKLGKLHYLAIDKFLVRGTENI